MMAWAFASFAVAQSFSSTVESKELDNWISALKTYFDVRAPEIEARPPEM